VCSLMRQSGTPAADCRTTSTRTLGGIRERPVSSDPSSCSMSTASQRLAIHHALIWLDGRGWLGGPKTAKSRRAIDLTTPTFEVLRIHHAPLGRATAGHGAGPDRRRPDLLRRRRRAIGGRHITTLQLKALLRRAELPPIRFHDLRHSFPTLQLAAGTPKIVSEVLRHSGPVRGRQGLR